MITVAIDAEKAKKALLKKGFQLVKGKDHIVLELVVNDTVTPVRTKLSHNHQDINNYLLNAMSKQLHCTREQFLALIQCSLSGEDYLLMLSQKNVV